MFRLVQMQHPTIGRGLALVDGSNLRLLSDYRSAYDLALASASGSGSLSDLIVWARSDTTLEYDPIYLGTAEWMLLPAWDNPYEPARCLVCGTGLSHRKSADNRNAMHAGDAAAKVTDSMRIYTWGEEGGRPEPGEIGVQPEWFYKGDGGVLRAHGEPLDVPNFADDGGEEAEIAAAYIISEAGIPCRVGFTTANEFSDHVMEAKNYLYLAPSKLRNCALGPELVIGSTFRDIAATASVERDGRAIWSGHFGSGEDNMVHSLANLEHHHFKYEAHRRPGDAHVHFFGTGAFSFGSGVRLKDGDEMIISFTGFGRALRNRVRIDLSEAKPVEVIAL